MLLTRHQHSPACFNQHPRQMVETGVPSGITISMPITGTPTQRNGDPQVQCQGFKRRGNTCHDSGFHLQFEVTARQASMKLSTLGIPLLLGLGIFFYLADINGVPSANNHQASKQKSPQPSSQPTKQKPPGYRACMKHSDEQYERDMIKFKRIRMKPEVNYGRLRDDKYGKGLNTITKEQLEREKECMENGLYF